MAVDGEVGGVDDPDPAAPDLAPFILFIRERRGEAPAQPVAMLVHLAESQFVYIYAPISSDRANTSLTATPLVCGEICIVFYSPE